MTSVSNLFDKYWETRTTYSHAKDIKNATNLNPTFLYLLSGEGFNPHYGTFPHSFHLMSAYAPIASDPTGPMHNTGSPAIDILKQQFTAWCKAFCAAKNGDSITIQLFSGNTLALCHALYALQVTGNPCTNILAGTYPAAQIDLDKHANSDRPTVFDVIDTSNLADHIGILNLLIASVGLLKKHPELQSVLYTKTLILSGQDTTKSFPECFCTDVPTIALLLGLAPRPYIAKFTTHSNVHKILFLRQASQYHECMTWSSPSSGDKYASQTECTVSFDAVTLAWILYGMYEKMFANEDISNIMASLLPSGIMELGQVHFLRETIAMLF